MYRGSEIMREVAWVVFDEIHYMRNRERGVVWEESIIMLPPQVEWRGAGCVCCPSPPNPTYRSPWSFSQRPYPTRTSSRTGSAISSSDPVTWCRPISGME